ncbi:transposase [mine drainage metagenome]|uniref:Transposase n=2 Tax=mine drainage metagenome TaxID=410659 RepID=T1C768_9ZZZZ
MAQGARKHLACRELGLTLRTFERWIRDGEVKADGRPGAQRPAPSNRLSEPERAEMLRVVHEPRCAALPPTQIVPRLADAGQYLASESTVYRLLRQAGELTHRGRAKAPVPRAIPRQCASGPHELWSWDISDLPGPVSGRYRFLYLVLDVYSRKLVAHEGHTQESADCAVAVIEQACARECIETPLILHQDHGRPMQASTRVAKLDALGIHRSYSRPGVSDDNPYSESLFRTVKDRPHDPGGVRKPRGGAPLDACLRARVQHRAQAPQSQVREPRRAPRGERCRDLQAAQGGLRTGPIEASRALEQRHP